MIFLCKRDREVIFPKGIPDIPSMDTRLQHTRWNGGDYIGQICWYEYLHGSSAVGSDCRAMESAHPKRIVRPRGKSALQRVEAKCARYITKDAHSVLRQLERSGLVGRLVLTESPVGVEYSLTKLGETLEGPIAAFYQWTSKHAAAVLDAQKSFDAKKVTHKSNPSR
jgi:hypothetical protein